jgi:Ser/Thr protein kinase RdoA (MazF antagonist)
MGARALFGADLFSHPEPQFREATPAAAAKVQALLAARYPALGGVEPEVRQSGAIELNSNNFLVRAASGRHIVKRWKSGAPGGDPRRQATLAQWLAGRGLPLPAFVPSATGELVVAEQGLEWCVQRYVEGRYYAGSASELRSAGAVILRLHAELEQAPEALREQKRIEHPLQEWQQLLASLEHSRADWPRMLGDELAALLSEVWPDIARALRSTLAMAQPLRDSMGLCHIDLHPHNVLVDAGRVAALLDFHSLAQAPRASMLAFNLFKLGRQAVVAAGAPGPDAALRGELGRLARSLPAAADLARAEILRRAMLVLRLNVREGNRDWNHVLPVQLRGLAEAEALFQP